MKICLVRLSALGDVVMMIPLIRTLQRNFPEAEITWIVGSSFASIIEKIEGIRVLPVKKIKSFRDLLEVRRILSRDSYDVLLATQASMSAHLLYPWIRAKRKIGYDAKRSKDFHRLFIKERIPFKREHTVEGFLSFARQMGAERLSFDGKIPLEESDRNWARETLGSAPYYVINPCTSKKEKDWVLSRYIDVIDWIWDEMELYPVITGGPSDVVVCSQLERELPCKGVNLAGKTTLRRLAGVLEGAEFVISPDTGPAHIASALGVPVIGLFSVTRPSLTGPYFLRDFIIDKHEQALELFARSQDPRQEWNVRVYHEDAMKLIEVEDVISKVKRLQKKEIFL